MVRCFDDENVIHVEGSTDPIRDIGIIDLELIMADLEMVDRRIDKAKKASKGDKKYPAGSGSVLRPPGASEQRRQRPQLRV